MPGWKVKNARWRAEVGWKPIDSPSARAEADTVYRPNPRNGCKDLQAAVAPSSKGRSKHKNYLCVAKQFRRHPDKALRKLAYEQAREQHEQNVRESGIENPTKGQIRFHGRCRDIVPISQDKTLLWENSEHLYDSKNGSPYDKWHVC